MNIASSYIKGLDEILSGGFIRPSTVLIAGTTGTGKTIFSMQSLFNAAREGEEICVFIPVISEPPAIIDSFMSGFSFYDPSLYQQNKMHKFTIDENLLERPNEILEFIEERIKEVRPDRIVVDPVNPIVYTLGEKESRKFWFKFTGITKGWNTLTLLTGEFLPGEVQKQTISYLTDGVIVLGETILENQTLNYLEIKKMRGTDIIKGKHMLKFSSDGIIIFPRATAGRKPIAGGVEEGRLKSGIEGLDHMLGGGFLRSRPILIAGGAGTGKTIFGMQFVHEGARNGEPGLIFSYDSEPDELIRDAQKIGMDFQPLIDKNLLKIISVSPVESYPDEHAFMIKDAVKDIGAKRVVFDSISDLESAIPDPIKVRDYVSSLIAFFRSVGATPLFTLESPKLTGDVQISERGVSFVVNTIIFLRYVEIGSEMQKALSVLKMRGSDHDKEIREFEITEEGIKVKLPFKQYEGLMSGSPRKSIEERFAKAFKF
jgi:circadian clock protein KaiC